MSDSIAGIETGQSKCQFVADAVNRILESLVIRCAKGEEIRDYFHVAAVGYGASVGSIFGGQLTGRDIVPISEVANNPTRVETRTKKVSDGAGGLVEQQVRFPIWVDPVANGGTPMRQALDAVHSVIDQWAGNHQTSFPPIVIHFTDGESTDGDPLDVAERVRNVRTADGETVMLNGHISARGGVQVVFPSSSEGLPDRFAQLLFNMSSPLPAGMAGHAASLGYPASETSRAFVFNARAEHVVDLLEIGTRPSNLR
jgi:hypothetical protein